MSKQRDHRRAVGRWGEESAARFLQEKGYQILEQNFRSQRGEIDLVVRDADTLVFVEVKAKQRDGFGEPEDRVDQAKQAQIGRVAAAYLQQNELDDVDCRFDVVSVTRTKDDIVIHHIEDAFWLQAE